MSNIQDCKFKEQAFEILIDEGYNEEEAERLLDNYDAFDYYDDATM